MSKRRKVVAGVFLAAAVAGSHGLRAQTSSHPITTKPEGNTPNCSYTGGVSDGGKTSGSSTCQPGPTPGTDPNLYVPPSANQRFPFPGSQPAAAPSDAAAPTPQANPAVPAAPGQNAVQRFPFPGDTPSTETPAPASSSSAPPAPDSSQSPLKDAGSSGSSSSSSSSPSDARSSGSGDNNPGYSSSNAGPDLPDDDPNAPMPTPQHHASRKKLPAPEKALSVDDKEAEDLQVAGFYQNDGNFKAAYDRAKEAVSLVDDDPAAHLALADAARKLGKLDEAETNYKKTLALDPIPKMRKAAEKSLKDMSGN